VRPVGPKDILAVRQLDGARESFCGRRCRGNFRGNCQNRISESPIKMGVFRINSMVSGTCAYRSAGSMRMKLNGFRGMVAALLSALIRW
jgi:hypothetical protein